MFEQMAQRLSRHFSTLTGRRVTFAGVRPSVGSKARQIFAAYTMFPDAAPMVVHADVPLLGSFAGALVGLPASEVSARLKVKPLDELMSDAIHEVLNIAGAVINNEQRVVLIVLTEEVEKMPEPGRILLAKAAVRSDFDVTIDEYEGGRLTVLTQQSV